MENNKKLHLTIEMDLDVEEMLKNDISLKMALDWVKLREDAVVHGFTINVDAPSFCASADHFQLPCGFYGLKRSESVEAPQVRYDLSRETFEIVQAGDPFDYVKDEEDVVRLVNSVMRNTKPALAHDSDVVAADISNWKTMVEKCETSLLHACCFYLFCECGETDHNLRSLLTMLCTGSDSGRGLLHSTSVMDILFHDLAARDPDHIAVSAYEAFKTSAGVKAAEEAQASCIDRINSITLGVLCDLMADMKAG